MEPVKPFPHRAMYPLAGRSAQAPPSNSQPILNSSGKRPFLALLGTPPPCRRAQCSPIPLTDDLPRQAAESSAAILIMLCARDATARAQSAELGTNPRGMRKRPRGRGHISPTHAPVRGTSLGHVVPVELKLKSPVTLVWLKFGSSSISVMTVS